MKRVWMAATALCLLLALSGCDGGDVQRGPTADVQGKADSGESIVENRGESGTEGAGTSGAENGEPADASGLTMRDILDANRTETLLSTRGSFLMEASYAAELNPAGQISVIYADGENVFLKSDSTQELHTNQGSYLFMDGYYGPALNPAPLDLSAFSMVLLDEQTTAREDILSVEREGDTITVRTALSADAMEDIFGTDLEAAGYQPGDSTEETYTLDASDLAVLACSSVLRRADGSSLEMGPMSVTYGADMPEDAVILREHMDAPDRRTVTAVLDPQTPEETVCSVTAQKGDRVFMFLPEGYYVYYKDPACTQEFDEEPDPNEDVTVYVPCMELADMLEAAGLAELADAGEADAGEADAEPTDDTGYTDDPAMYDGASHRHAQDAERDMMEELEGRGEDGSNP